MVTAASAIIIEVWACGRLVNNTRVWGLLAQLDLRVNPCFVWNTKFRQEQYQSLDTLVQSIISAVLNRRISRTFSTG